MTLVEKKEREAQMRKVETGDYYDYSEGSN
jgi:hypothetical protein